MKRISTAIIFVGIAMLIFALSSDVALDGMGGRRITNYGLMHDRLVNTILSVTMILGGLLLKMFGGPLSGPHLQGIDQLPKSEYIARWATTILVSACVWTLVVMYLWPTTLVAVTLLAVIAWCSFLPHATYTVLKRVWLGALLLALVMVIWHGIALAKPWFNDLTYRLIDKGVILLGTGDLPPLFAALLGGPLLIAIAGFTVSMRKARRN